MATRTKPAAKTVPMSQEEQDYHAQQLAIVEEPPEETPEDRVNAMLAGIGGDGKGKVKVYRTNETTRNLDYCKEYTAADFEIGGFDLIRETFGPGDYEMRFWGTHPDSGRYAMLRRVPITFAPMLATAPAKQATESSGLTSVLENLTREIIAIKQTPAPAPVDPMVQMTQMFGFMKLMREAMGSDDKPKNQLGEIVAAMRELREVSEEINPRPEKEQPETMIGALKPILELVANSQRQQNQHQLPAPQIPASLQTNAAENQPALSADQKTQLDMLTAQMNLLFTMASSKQDPESCAASFYPILPDELIDLLQQEKWFENLAQLEPRCNDHKEWLTAVRDQLMVMIAEDDADADTHQEQKTQTRIDKVKKPATPAMHVHKKAAPAKV